MHNFLRNKTPDCPHPGSVDIENLEEGKIYEGSWRSGHGEMASVSIREATTSQNLVKKLGKSFAITSILLVRYRGKKSLFSITYKRRYRFSMANYITEKHHRVVMWPFRFVHLLPTSTTFGCSFGNFISKISV